MVEYYVWLVLLLFLLPPLAYVLAKMITLGVLRGKRAYRDYEQRTKQNTD